MVRTPFGSSGVPIGTAKNNDMPRRAYEIGRRSDEADRQGVSLGP